MRLLELTSDTVFKAFMMSERTKDYKARLIHLITGIPEEDLKEAVYESNELSVTNKNNKVYKTDIIVKIDNHIINIEMNQSYYKGLFEKNGTYYHKLRSEQFNKGDSYLEINKVIQINIDDFHKFNGNKLLYKFTMREVNTNELESEFLESYHIDLTYLKDKCYNEIKDELERICLLFIDKNNEYKSLIKGDNIMSEAYDELERISRDTGIIGLYDKEQIERKILNTRLQGARLEGIEEGKKEGINQRNIEIAKNMLKENIDILIIEKVTGLTGEQINNIEE